MVRNQLIAGPPPPPEALTGETEMSHRTFPELAGSRTVTIGSPANSTGPILAVETDVLKVIGVKKRCQDAYSTYAGQYCGKDEPFSERGHALLQNSDHCIHLLSLGRTPLYGCECRFICAATHSEKVGVLDDAIFSTSRRCRI